MRLSSLVLFLAAFGFVGCGPRDGAAPARQMALGPVDGRGLPLTDLAPDFSLVTLAGPVVTLSDFRGERNVVLVFYRGYW